MTGSINRVEVAEWGKLDLSGSNWITIKTGGSKECFAVYMSIQSTPKGGQVSRYGFARFLGKLPAIRMVAISLF